MGKYYAVKNGFHKGIFDSWEDTEKNVNGFTNAIYKSFSTIEEAEQYLEEPVSYTQNEGSVHFFYQDEIHSFKLNELEKIDFDEIADDEQIRSRVTEIIQLLLNERIQKSLEGVENTEIDEDDTIFEPYNPDQVKYTTKGFTV